MAADTAFGGRLDAADFIAAQRLHLSAANRRFIKIDIALIVLGATIVISAHLKVIESIPTAYVSLGWMLLGSGIGLILLQWSVSRTLQPRAWRRIFAQQKAMHEEFTYRVDDSGLYVSTPLGQAHRPWENFLRYRENDALFLLYHSDVTFELLPKRWFADDTGLNAFSAEVARRISR